MSVLEEIKIYKEYEGEDQFYISKIFFKQGTYVKAKALVMEIEAAKATLPVYSGESGYIEYMVKEGDQAEYGSVLIRITDEELSSFVRTKEEDKEVYQPEMSEAAIRLIEKENIDPNIFNGMDIVSSKDVRKFLGIDTASRREHVSIKNGNSEIDNLVEQNRLTSCLSFYFDFEDDGDMEDDYKSFTNTYFVSCLISGIKRTVEKYPLLNNFYYDNSVHKHIETEVGLAIDLSEGLKIVRIDTQDGSVESIMKDIFKKTKQYIRHQLNENISKDISIVVTDLSQNNVYGFVPVIPSKTSSIIGLSAVDKKLGRVALSITFDHRILNGRYVAEFMSELLQTVKKLYKGSE